MKFVGFVLVHFWFNCLLASIGFVHFANWLSHSLHSDHMILYGSFLFIIQFYWTREPLILKIYDSELFKLFKSNQIKIGWTHWAFYINFNKNNGLPSRLLDFSIYLDSFKFNQHTLHSKITRLDHITYSYWCVYSKIKPKKLFKLAFEERKTISFLNPNFFI